MDDLQNSATSWKAFAFCDEVIFSTDEALTKTDLLEFTELIRKQVELRGVKIGAPTEIRIFPSKSSTEIKNLPLHKLSVKLKMSKFVLALFPEELLLNDDLLKSLEENLKISMVGLTISMANGILSSQKGILNVFDYQFDKLLNRIISQVQSLSVNSNDPELSDKFENLLDLHTEKLTIVNGSIRSASSPTMLRSTKTAVINELATPFISISNEGKMRPRQDGQPSNDSRTKTSHISRCDDVNRDRNLTNDTDLLDLETEEVVPIYGQICSSPIKK